MTSLRTYSIRPQATAWLRCSGMSMRIGSLGGKPEGGLVIGTEQASQQAKHIQPSFALFASEDNTKEAGR